MSDDDLLDDACPEPPSVYPAANNDQWVVEAPAGRDAPTGGAVTTFSGPNAQYCALNFAYETFGNARLFYTAIT